MEPVNAAMVRKLLELQAAAWDATAQLDERNAKGWQENPASAEAGDDGQVRFEIGHAQGRSSLGLAHARMLRELAAVIVEDEDR